MADPTGTGGLAGGRGHRHESRPTDDELAHPGGSVEGGGVVSVSFERAAVADAEALVAVQVAAFHSDALAYPAVEIGGPPGYDSVEEAVKKIARDEYYKIVSDGRIIGGIVVFDRGQGRFHLDLIYLDPVHHGRGIGTRAMRFIERAHRATTWTLDTPSWALRNQHFYEKLGYAKVGETVHPDITLFAYEKRVRGRASRP
jgi:GNAT superfamily N-acetyltransferase